MADPCLKAETIRKLEIDIAVAKNDISSVKSDIGEVKFTMREIDNKMTAGFKDLQKQSESDRKWKVGITITAILTIAGIIVSILK